MADSRYRAFISYNHRADGSFARRLHRRLETHALPQAVLRTIRDAPHGTRQIGRIFRDEDELVPGENLPERIQRALKDSEFLVVICSPAAVKSLYVNLEIEWFRTTNNRNNIIAIVTDGEPDAKRRGFPATRECMPRALQWWTFPTGTNESREPLWIDWRKGRGDRSDFLRLVAALLSLPSFDDLIRRDNLDRRRRRWVVTAVVAIVLAIAITLVTATVVTQRELASRKSQALADASQEAAARGDNERAARLAMAGLVAARAPLFNADSSSAEAALRRAFAENPRRLAPIAMGENLSDAILTSDRRFVITAAQNGVRIWDAGTGNPSGPALTARPARLLAVSPDGRSLAIGEPGVGTSNGSYIRITLWNLADRSQMGSPVYLSAVAPTDLEFSPDGARLAACGEFNDGGGRVQVWDISAVPSGSTPQSLVDLTHHAGFHTIFFSPDGLRLVTSSGDGVRLWDMQTRTQIGADLLGDASPADAAFSPDGTQLVTGTGAGRIQIWDSTTLTEIGATMIADGPIHSVLFHPDGRRIVASTVGQSTSVWDIATRQQVERAFRPSGRLHLARDGALAVTAHGDGARMWAIAPPAPQLVARTPGGSIANSAAFSPDGSLLIRSAGYPVNRGGVFVSRVGPSNTPIASIMFDANYSDVESLDIAPDGRSLVTSGWREVRIFSLPDLTPGARVALGIGNIDRAVYSPDGARIAFIGSAHNKVELRDARTLAPLGAPHPTGPAGQLIRVAWSPDGNRLALSGYAGIELRNVADWSLVGSLDKVTYDPVRFSPDGTSLWFVASDGLATHLWRWDPTAPSLVKTRIDLPEFNDVIALSSDGTYLAVAGRLYVTLIDTRSETRIARYWNDRLTFGVTDMMFLASGAILLSTNDDPGGISNDSSSIYSIDIGNITGLAGAALEERVCSDLIPGRLGTLSTDEIASIAVLSPADAEPCANR
jgi:WD40 repeat protein